MPQLDKVTFLSQFFWLCFFYLGFYYQVQKYYLPKISRILTLRKKKMNFTQEGFPFLQQENQQVGQNLETILCGSLSLSRTLFNDLFFRTTNWLDQSQTSVNKTHYNTANNSYIQTIGNTSLSENTMLYNASSNLPTTLKASKAITTIKTLKKILVLFSQKKKQDQKRALKKTSTVQEKLKKSKKGKKE